MGCLGEAQSNPEALRESQLTAVMEEGAADQDIEWFCRKLGKKWPSLGCCSKMPQAIRFCEDICSQFWGWRCKARQASPPSSQTPSLLLSPHLGGLSLLSAPLLSLCLFSKSSSFNLDSFLKLSSSNSTNMIGGGMHYLVHSKQGDGSFPAASGRQAAWPTAWSLISDL